MIDVDEPLLQTEIQTLGSQPKENLKPQSAVTLETPEYWYSDSIPMAAIWKSGSDSCHLFPVKFVQPSTVWQSAWELLLVDFPT